MLVLLDLVLPVLPGADGIELLGQLADLPVIVISRNGRDETIARAFESGCRGLHRQAVLAAPSSSRASERRCAAVSAPRQFVHGQLAIDYARRRVTVGGRAVALTPIEYEVLRILSVNVGSVVTAASLLRQVWGTRSAAATEPVRAFVKKLRDKLGDSAAGPTWIVHRARRRLPHAGPRGGVISTGRGAGRARWGLPGYRSARCRQRATHMTRWGGRTASADLGDSAWA